MSRWSRDPEILRIERWCYIAAAIVAAGAVVNVWGWLV